VSNPTWARILAEVTGLILVRGPEYIRERKGLYHLAGGGYASRLEWAKVILAIDPNLREQITQALLPTSIADFPVTANRPLFSHWIAARMLFAIFTRTVVKCFLRFARHCACPNCIF